MVTVATVGVTFAVVAVVQVIAAFGWLAVCVLIGQGEGSSRLANPRGRGGADPQRCTRMVIPVSDDLCDRSALDQLVLLERRELSARELLDAHLERIEAVNPAVNAVVDLRPEIGRARARAVDERRARGEDAGPLGGVVVAHKDLVEAEGFITTYGTPSMRDNLTDVDSHIVAVMRGAGAVAVGKTNTPEFGAGSHTVNEVYGMTANPWDTTRSAGGSSGGAAVALATGMVGLADGSDQGGSLRNPAAWAGVVGLRPTPGVVPKVVGNAWNPNTTLGPMARTVDDVALLLGVLNAPDERDPLWRPVDCATPVRPLERARVAWSPDLGGLPVGPEVRGALAAVPPVVEALGWTLTEAEPDLSTADRVFETLRHWRQPVALAPFREHLSTIKQVVRDELAAGEALTGAQVDAAFVELGRIRARVLEFFDVHDLLLAPVTQIDPFPVEWEYPTEIDGRAMSSYIEWMRSCSRVTVLGAPAMSLPACTSTAGLPVGVQIIGRPGADATVLAAAKALEQALGGWRGPDLAALGGHRRGSGATTA